jgi:CHAD domain-containing protein
VIRLVRSGLDKTTARDDNAALRDAGRLLSGARDAWVLVKTLDSLNGDQAPTPLRQQLLAEYEAVAGGDVPVGAPVALEDALRRTRAWAPEGDIDLLADGLQRTYGRGRLAFEAAEKSPTTDNLHQWRKRVKDLWYSLQLVESAWPRPFGALVEEVHHVSDLLGNDHDLGVFAGHVQPTGALADLLVRRRCDLQAEALGLGARVYAEKPKGFARRVVTACQTWRSTPTSG